MGSFSETIYCLPFKVVHFSCWCLIHSLIEKLPTVNVSKFPSENTLKTHRHSHLKHTVTPLKSVTPLKPVTHTNKNNSHHLNPQLHKRKHKITNLKTYSHWKHLVTALESNSHTNESTVSPLKPQLHHWKNTITPLNMQYYHWNHTITPLKIKLRHKNIQPHWM